MDYDRTSIPDNYDRGRDHGPEMLDLWMNAIASRVNACTPDWILDLGCGTGRFSDALANRFDCDLVGIDPSFKMLQQAKRKRSNGRIHYQIGCAEALPLRSNSTDLVFASMSFHHFTDRMAAARECRRVLRDGGYALVRTGSREQIPFYPYYTFFPASHPILEDVLPDHSAICAPFEAAGFDLADWSIVTQTIAPSWTDYAEKLATGADSVLARLDPEDFERGLAAVRQHGDRVGAQAITEPIDLFVFC